jgi:predicted nucleic acid-binding protein
MAAKVFVDTNVLVYSRDASEPSKQAKAMAWLRHIWNTRTGCLSYQVLQEFYITVTEKLDPGLDRESARKDIRSLLLWRPIAVDNRVLDGAWHIQDRFGLSWWDALIVSAAQVSGCNYLLSEDLQEGQLFGNLRIIDPFETMPESLEC